jgi:hypothetical protein
VTLPGPGREIIVEPLEIPVPEPQREPAPEREPKPEPVPVREPEKVPA